MLMIYYFYQQPPLLHIINKSKFTKKKNNFVEDPVVLSYKLKFININCYRFRYLFTVSVYVSDKVGAITCI